MKSIVYSIETSSNNDSISTIDQSKHLTNILDIKLTEFSPNSNRTASENLTYSKPRHEDFHSILNIIINQTLIESNFSTSL